MTRFLQEFTFGSKPDEFKAQLSILRRFPDACNCILPNEGGLRQLIT
jgi:hypothetical protein